jgi:predicted porin
MKKSLLATAVAAAMVLSTSAVFAATADPTIDGSVTYQFRNNTDDSNSNATKKVNKTTIILNVNEDLTGGWDVYARASLQAANGGKDFNDKVYGDSNYAASLDQYGFKYTNGDNQLKIGRQSAWVGETGLFYDTTGKVGRKIMADGLTYNGKNDSLSYKVIAVQEDVYYNDAIGTSKNKLYVGHVNYNFTPNFVLGTTFAKYNLDNKDSYYGNNGFGDGKDSNLWAVNTSYTLDKATLFAEYGKSNYDINNKAYDFGIAYNFDEKNSISATYFKVEDNGDINHYTTFDPNAKGMYYSFTHKFNKVTSLNFFYDDAKYISNTLTNPDQADKNYTSFRTTLNYNF